MSALNELRQLHAQMEAKLDALEALTTLAEPPMHELSAVRLALTRASRGRTALLDRLYPALITQASGRERMALESLREQVKADRVASTQHIADWTIREITARWDAYCDASRAMRAAMRARIERERAVVYPLLAETDGTSPEVGEVSAG